MCFVCFHFTVKKSCWLVLSLLFSLLSLVQSGLIFLLFVFYHFTLISSLSPFFFCFVIPALSHSHLRRGKRKHPEKNENCWVVSVNVWCGAMVCQGHRIKIFPWITWKFVCTGFSWTLCCFVVTSLISKCWLDWIEWESHENALKITLFEDLGYAILGTKSHSI